MEEIFKQYVLKEIENISSGKYGDEKKAILEIMLYELKTESKIDKEKLEKLCTSNTQTN